jgi:hypothetical protein
LVAPLKELLDRNRQRDSSVSDSVIQEMARNFEPLCTSHRCHLVSGAASDVWQEVLEKLTWSQQRHNEMAESTNFIAIEPESTAHRIFLLLNKAVSLLVLEADPDRRKTVAHSLIPIKQIVYTNLKSQIYDEDVLRAVKERNSLYFKALLLGEIDKQQ